MSVAMASLRLVLMPVTSALAVPPSLKVGAGNATLMR
jgi:hypothetical protein